MASDDDFGPPDGQTAILCNKKNMQTSDFLCAKGTQGFIHCLFKAASLAMRNKQMLSSLATFEALSLVITKAIFIWFGSASVERKIIIFHELYVQP